MNAKGYLVDILRGNDLVDALDCECRRLEKSIKNIPVHGIDLHNTQKHDISDNIAKLEHYLDIDRKAMMELEARKQKAKLLILSMNDKLQASILIDHYINQLSFEEIAVSKHYSYRWVIHLHGEALMQLNKIMDKEDKIC